MLQKRWVDGTTTSNGTVSRKRYSGLVKTEIEKIIIQLGSVKDENILYLHTADKIRENIESLDQERGDKIFTVNAILHQVIQESIW